MTTAIDTADPDQIVALLDPPPAPAPPPDLQSYRRLILRAAAGDALSVEEVKATLANAQRKPRDFADDIRCARNRKAAVDRLATADRPLEESVALARQRIRGAKLQADREIPEHERAIVEHQRAVADLRQRLDTAEAELREIHARHEAGVAHCRQQLQATAPAVVRQRLEELQRRNEQIRLERVICHSGDWRKRVERARRELAEETARRDELQGIVNDKELAATPSTVKMLKESASSLRQLRAAVAKAESEAPDEARLNAEQEAIVREYNALVEALFDWQQFDLTE